MRRRSAPLRYVEQQELRQATYDKRKRSLMRKAMELAVMCNSQVALVMFDDKGRLTQFSTNDMDQLLEQYGNAVLKPHERYTPQDVLLGNMYANGFGLGSTSQAAGTAATAQAATLPTSPGDSPASSSEAFQAAAGTQQMLGPLGLAVDASTFPPLSPRSQEAYARITSQFDFMLQQQQRFEAAQWQHMQEQMRQQQRRHKAAKAKAQQLPEGLQRHPSSTASLHDVAGDHDGNAEGGAQLALALLLQQPSGSAEEQGHSRASAAHAALDAALPRPGAGLVAPLAAKRVLQPAVARRPKLLVTLSGSGATSGGGATAGSNAPQGVAALDASVTPESHAPAGAGDDDQHAHGADPAQARGAEPPAGPQDADAPDAAVTAVAEVGPSSAADMEVDAAVPQEQAAPLCGNEGLGPEPSGDAAGLGAATPSRKRPLSSPAPGCDGAD